MSEDTDWMVERRRRGRDTVVERVEHTREIKDIPPELLARMDAIESAYKALLADKARMAQLEARADQTDGRIMALAEAVAGIRSLIEGGGLPTSGSTDLAIRVEQIEQHIVAGSSLADAVQALMAALDMVKGSLAYEIKGVAAKVEYAHTRLAGVETMIAGFEQAFAEMGQVGKRRFGVS